MKKGFTLIEIIGVIAILAILATAVSPNIIRHLRNAKFDAEENSLQAINNTFKNYILQSSQIPSEASWSTDLVSISDLSANDLIAPQEGNRRFVLHPSHNINAPLPYDQATRFQTGGNINAGTVQTTLVNEGRAILISGVENSAPTTAISATNFDNIWNGAGPTAYSQIDSVRIEKINLSQFFHGVTVTITGGTPSWSLGTSATVNTFSAIPPNSFTVQLLQGTRINVFTDNAGLNIAGSVIVDSPIALTFDGSNWTW